MMRWNKKRALPRNVSFLQRLEGRIIRIMVLSVVLLAVFQMKSVMNPVDFYLKFSGDIDAPAFKYQYYIDEAFKEDNKSIESIKLTFVTIPENSPVKVWQNNKLVGIINQDAVNFEIQPGSVYLDATEIAYPVTVEIILNQTRYHLDLDGDSKSFDVQLKSPAAS